MHIDVHMHMSSSFSWFRFCIFLFQLRSFCSYVVCFYFLRFSFWITKSKDLWEDHLQNDQVACNTSTQYSLVSHIQLWSVDMIIWWCNEWELPSVVNWFLVHDSHFFQLQSSDLPLPVVSMYSLCTAYKLLWYLLKTFEPIRWWKRSPDVISHCSWLLQARLDDGLQQLCWGIEKCHSFELYLINDKNRACMVECR